MLLFLWWNINAHNLGSKHDEEGGGEGPNRGRDGWRGGMLWGIWWLGQLLGTFWRGNLGSEAKRKNSNDVVMNKIDGLLIQSWRRLWFYHRGGEFLQGCIHTERRNLRGTRGLELQDDGGQLHSYGQQSCFHGVFVSQADRKSDFCSEVWMQVDRWTQKWKISECSAKDWANMTWKPECVH